MADRVLAAGNNFLIPNGTFFVVLIIFVIVLVVISKVVVPPISRVMKERHDLVQATLDNNRATEEHLEAAAARYREALDEARAESAKIREEARAEGQQIVDEMRDKARAETAKISAQGDEQLASQRSQIVSQLRGEIDGLSTRLATRVVGTELSADDAHREVVERFLDNKEVGA